MMRSFIRLGILVAICGNMLPFEGRTADSDLEFFEMRIRPVLAEHCYECHSASAKKLKGGLRVDSMRELLQGGETGPAIVPGKPERSLLISAIAHRDSELAMPPKKARLADSIITDFEKWIRDGAVWPTTNDSTTSTNKNTFDLEDRKKMQAWLWTAPAHQPIPAVKNSHWPLSQEDFFILNRLEQAGIQPAPPTDERTWLRRVHFAITGLPPTRDEIRDFLSGETAGAREHVVDQLLASPHFGERWARHWMDLVRYAESRGHESDFIIANAWHYRDYLIRAFNEDVPYNQFVLEHLAGDLLPNPRLRPGTDINESVLATAWPFLGEENHSPVDIRQDECERIDNKVDVLSKTFLGLTVSCARCHDHKFDPIRAQDYYALTGFMLSSSYRQVRFEAMENNRRMGDELELLRARFAPQLAKAVAASFEDEIGHIAEYLLKASEPAQTNTEATEQINPWQEHLRQAATNETHPLSLFAQYALQPENRSVPFSKFVAAKLENLPCKLPDDVRIISDYTRPNAQAWKVDGEAFGRRPAIPGDIIFSNSPTQPIARVMTYGAARRDLFWSRVTSAPDNENDSGRLAATARSGQMLCTPTVTLGAGKLHYLIKGKARVYAAVDSHIMLEGPLHGVLTKTFDSGSADRLRWVTHDLSAYSGHRAHIEFGPDGENELEVLIVVESEQPPQWEPRRPFNPEPAAESPEDYAKAFQASVASACDKFSKGRDLNPQDAALVNWLVQNPALLRSIPNKESISLAKQFLAAQSNIAQRVRWESHTAVSWFDGTGVDESVLLRGKPFKTGVPAPRSLPVAFASSKPITSSASSGRYELALQMIAAENPLVARVIVNRVWHHLFGRGIVASVDNFGALGDRPSHPELLDHLAWQFVHEDQWSIKRLIKRLVLTQTFNMSSVSADSQTEERDPSHALLHRMPVRRLEGEVIRDALLAVSGRLAPTVGGAPQPMHLTEFLVGRGRPDKSGPLDGDGRRSVYMAMRRNFLPTLMATFDAPTPFSTVGKRNVTNVPAQSLALMNDPLFHQQAEVWAKRLLRETRGADEITRIKWLFESAFGRLPNEAEINTCTQSLQDLRKLENAPSTEDTDEWTELCHALLNSNEFIYLR